MTGLQHLFLTAGAIYGFLGVAAGAFGAHFLKSKLPVESLDIFEVAVRYQMYHALALIGLVALLGFITSIWLAISGWLFIIGMFIFSGSLYMLVFSGIRLWGAVTPVGGVLLLLGWLSLFLAGILGRAS